MEIESIAAYLALPCTLAIFMIGYYLGRSKVKHEREAVLRALSSMLESADELSQDVEGHKTELADMGRTVDNLPKSDEMGGVRDLLLTHVQKVIKSNKKLEDDLTCARYSLAQQAQELDKTRVEARTDELSQVGNRKAFDEALDFRLSRWNRQQEWFALLMCDVDHFKWINDTHGHQAGDQVVKGVGELMKRYLANRHFVGRFGGDEFALLIDCEDRQAAIDLARRIHKAAETHNFSAAQNGERVAITFSMGLAFVAENDSRESLLARADARLYEAKQAGRNCLKIESPATRSQYAEETVASSQQGDREVKAATAPVVAVESTIQKEPYSANSS
ncbi:MAG: GGDEF domain-containing protein [Planctomycetales bacterium]|nr:GGDEF domain-containing protein [Planctomycetales bacterium]